MKTLLISLHPPQSYTYFSDEMIEKLGVKFNG